MFLGKFTTLCNISQHEFIRNNFATEFRQISSTGIWQIFYDELDGFQRIRFLGW